MKKQITYKKQGDYYLPTFKLPKQDNRPIGIWAQIHRRYLKTHHKIRYYNLLTSGTLYTYLADIDKQAEDMFFQIVKELSEKQGVNEKLKLSNQMLWVKKMNNIRNIAREIVNAELIYK